MIINQWDAAFLSRMGGSFPQTYLTFDTEYSGGSHKKDYVVEIGHTMVEDGRVVDQLNLVLNCFQLPGVDHGRLDYQLKTMRSRVGPGWKLLPNYVRTRGIDPIKALGFYEQLFRIWDQRGLCFVAQNGHTADERMLNGMFQRYLDKSFELPENRYIDVGGIFRATKVWQSPPGSDLHNFRGIVLPTARETPKAYFHRIVHAQLPNCKWKMDDILTEYGILEKYDIQEEQRHSAGFDARCVHWLMQEYHARHRQQTNPFSSPQAMERAVDKVAGRVPQPTPETPPTKRKSRTLSQSRRRRRQRPV